MSIRPSPSSWATRFAIALSAWRSADQGVSALEFALLAPILALTLAATLDFGLVTYIRLSLNQAVSAGANYAMVNGGDLSTNAVALANTVAAIIPTANDITVVVNNGPTVRRVGGVVTSSGSQSGATACYCPKLDGAGLTWGDQMSCGNACAAGGVAGQYVLVTAGEAYSPMFSAYGFVQNGVISVRSITQVK